MIRIKIMKRVLIPIFAAGILLSGCSSDGNMYRPHYLAATDYDAYYDDAYGPFNDGYWGPGDTYYYRGGAFGRYVPDRGMHFHHEAGTGMHAVHGMPRGGGGRGGGPVGGAGGGGGGHAGGGGAGGGGRGGGH
jgi:hypothetical protein